MANQERPNSGMDRPPSSKLPIVKYSVKIGNRKIPKTKNAPKLSHCEHCDETSVLFVQEEPLLCWHRAS